MLYIGKNRQLKFFSDVVSGFHCAKSRGTPVHVRLLRAPSSSSCCVHMGTVTTWAQSPCLGRCFAGAHSSGASLMPHPCRMPVGPTLNSGYEGQLMPRGLPLTNGLKESMADFPGGAVVKNPPANAGDMGSSPGPGRSHMPRSN